MRSPHFLARTKWFTNKHNINLNLNNLKFSQNYLFHIQVKPRKTENFYLGFALYLIMYHYRSSETFEAFCWHFWSFEHHSLKSSKINKLKNTSIVL